MLLQFELDGQSCTAGAYTFTLSNALNFERLSLRSVSVQCGNDKLAQTWSYTTENVTFDAGSNSRALAAPLYLDMSSFLGDTSTAHYLPTVHPYGSARTHVLSTGVVDITHATAAAGSNAHVRLDLPLIAATTPVHWPAGKELTFALKHRSVETPGQYGFSLEPLDNVSFDNTCRVCITLETDGGAQPAAAATSQAVALFSGDNGASSDPTLAFADFNAPVERGGADAHTGAYLVAYSQGNNTDIQRLHVGPYTCAAAHELAIVRVINVAGSSAAPGLHRTSLSTIANVDSYIRTLSGGTSSTGYGGLSYTKSTNPQGGDFDATVNYFYIVAITRAGGD